MELPFNPPHYGYDSELLCPPCGGNLKTGPAYFFRRIELGNSIAIAVPDAENGGGWL